jgi:hypothetical protein
MPETQTTEQFALPKPVVHCGLQTQIEQHQPPPLETITRPNLTTVEAAYYLNRKPQTLRGYACREDGPIRPLRVHGRLAWPVSELKRVLGVPA